ncbi:MAG TPA: flagellin [Tepidisphaeraceae bacterium]|jgi:flagellin|nr:flagellin [Tepidisphaeraceae bacterium]
MARIETNVASLVAQNALANSQSSEDIALQRLSTGLRINSGADDPAGLIESQNLQSEMTGLQQAVNNSSQATNVITTADGALTEVSSLLNDINGLVVESANSGALSSADLQANQLQIDSDVQSITRIAGTTSFAGLNLLDGSLNYITSGVSNSAISALSISQANLGTSTSMPVDVNVISSAKVADLQFRASAITKSTTLEISGNTGVQTLSFVSGTTASAIAFAVNNISDSTGVTANLINSANANSGINFKSSGYGSGSFVSIQAQTGAFQTTDTAGADKERAVGADVVATINGALTVGSGLELKLNTSSLDLDMTLSDTFGAGKTNFAITGGGALFQLGAQVNSQQQVSIGIGSVAASSLGNNGVGFLNDIVTGGNASVVGGQSETASQIVAIASQQVAELQGRLGAFEKNTLETNSASLQVTLENVTSSQSDIADADFASETANLTRAQILVQAGTTVLATANSTPNTVLALLQNA